MKKLMLFLLLLIIGTGVMANGFPKIASFWGCPPSTRDFKLWSGYDMLICYESPYDTFVSLSKGVRAENPDIIILDTAILTSFGRPELWYPWMKDEWWLKDSKGNRITTWAGQVYIPNLTKAECIDALIAHVDGTLGTRDSQYGRLLKEGYIQGLMQDSVVSNICDGRDIDADEDGMPDNPEELNRKWLEGQNLYFKRLAEKYPGILLLANDADENHRPFVNGRLWESGRGMDAVSTRHWWSMVDAVDYIKSFSENCRKPSICVNLASSSMGYDSWRIGLDYEAVATEGERDRARREYSRMRAGLFAALMTDEYFGYDFGTVSYGDTRFWYKEYEAPLGNALGDANTVFLHRPTIIYEWNAGDTHSPFFEGQEKEQVTGDGLLIDKSDNSSNFSTVFSTDPKKLYFAPGHTYQIEMEILTLKKAADVFQIALRSPTGGWEASDRGTQVFLGVEGDSFVYKTLCTPGQWKDYSLCGFIRNNGKFLVKSLKVTETGPCYMYRDFEGGRVYVSGSTQPLTVRLPKPMRLLDDAETPRYIIEADDEADSTEKKGTWLWTEGPFNRYYGKGYYWSMDKEGEFVWSFAVPSADEYDIYACLAGDFRQKDWPVQPESAVQFTTAALYSIQGREFIVNQSAADGGWVKIGTVKLRKGIHEISVKNTIADTRLAADCIRLESRKRLNDGSMVKQITLLPEDGRILVNEK